MKRWFSIFLATWIAVWPAMASNDANKQSGGAGSVPGMSGTTGNGETLGYLYTLHEFAGLNASQFMARLWVDPFYGNDTTGNGSYNLPYKSFWKIKSQCIQKSHMRCTVKGRNRVFTHELLTLTYAAGDHATLQPGEIVTFLTPAGTATVLAVDGNLAATTWLTGTDPRVSAAPTTFTGGSSGATGTVAKVEDTINGNRNWVIAAADITVATDVITATGNDYTTGDGPFFWYNQTTMPTFGAGAITEGVTDVYICTVVAGVSFKLGTTSGCGTLFDFTSQGTGSNQLILRSAVVSGGLTTGIGPLDCPDEKQICTVFESEFPDAPWTLDGNRLYLNGAIALYAGIAGAADTFWSGLAGGGVYNPATGGIWQPYSTSGDPSDTPWLGIQNGIISNMSHDCLSIAPGGKLVALNIRCAGMRNGGPTAGSTNGGDRSQIGMTHPEYQAHNSGMYAGGVNAVTAGNASDVTWWINNDGSFTEMGSDQASGAFFNPNDSGVSRVISQGMIKTDAITGDVNCAGTVCNSPMVTQPGGDFVLIGPELQVGGTTTVSVGFGFSGSNARIQVAKTLWNMKGTWGGTNTTAPSVIGSSGAGTGAAALKTVRFWETTFKSVGPEFLFTLCPLGNSTTTKAAALQRLDFSMKNILLDAWDSFYVASVQKCGVLDSAASPYTTLDAVGRGNIHVEGIWDTDETATCGAGNPCWFIDPNARTKAVMHTDIIGVADSAGNVPTAATFSIFNENTGDSGGVGVDGEQWGSPNDAQFRCQPGKECYHPTALPLSPYIVDFTSYYNTAASEGRNIGCLPSSVIGGSQPLCSLILTPQNVGGR